jgi:3-oxoacyl-[acyl-carrier-protein] synthase-1
MLEARRLIYHAGVRYCIIAGVDSLLTGATLDGYQKRNRLLTSKNSDGFIPGEAACAVLVGPPGTNIGTGTELVCTGIGVGHEEATLDSEEPLRADGLVQAFRAAFKEAESSIADIDFRITDANGEQYWFKEAALAVSRTLRVPKEGFTIWHPVDCVGEIGAAIGPCCLGVTLAAVRKKYASGRGPLCHFGGDDGERIALTLLGAPQGWA